MSFNVILYFQKEINTSYWQKRKSLIISYFSRSAIPRLSRILFQLPARLSSEIFPLFLSFFLSFCLSFFHSYIMPAKFIDKHSDVSLSAIDSRKLPPWFERNTFIIRSSVSPFEEGKGSSPMNLLNKSWKTRNSGWIDGIVAHGERLDRANF